MSTWICTCNALNPGIAFFCHLCGEPQPPTFFYASNNTTTGETMSTERELPQKLFAYLTHGGDWWATEEKNFRPGMIDLIPKEKCVGYVPASELEKAQEEIAALKAKDEELENLKKEIHALKIEMFSVAGGREILKAENARLRSEAAKVRAKAFEEASAVNRRSDLNEVSKRPENRVFDYLWNTSVILEEMAQAARKGEGK